MHIFVTGPQKTFSCCSAFRVRQCSVGFCVRRCFDLHLCAGILHTFATGEQKTFCFVFRVRRCSVFVANWCDLVFCARERDLVLRKASFFARGVHNSRTPLTVSVSLPSMSNPIQRKMSLSINTKSVSVIPNPGTAKPSCWFTILRSAVLVHNLAQAQKKASSSPLHLPGIPISVHHASF